MSKQSKPGDGHHSEGIKGGGLTFSDLFYRLYAVAKERCAYFLLKKGKK